MNFLYTILFLMVFINNLQDGPTGPPETKRIPRSPNGPAEPQR